MRWSPVVPLLAVAWLSTPLPVLACTCVVPGGLYEEYTKSDAVFLGEVTAIDSADGDYPYSAWVTFRVESQWKGGVGEEIRILNALSGAACGADLHLGSRYLVFAYEVSSSPGVLATNLCTRTHASSSRDPDLALLNGPWPPLSLATSPNPSRGPIRVMWMMPQTDRDSDGVRLEVVDFQGRSVRTLLSDAVAMPGPRETVWDGRDDDGRPMPAGIYFVRFHGAGRPMSRKLVKTAGGR